MNNQHSADQVDMYALDVVWYTPDAKTPADAKRKSFQGMTLDNAIKKGQAIYNSLDKKYGNETVYIQVTVSIKLTNYRSTAYSLIRPD